MTNVVGCLLYTSISDLICISFILPLWYNVLDPPTGKRSADRGEVRHMQNARSDWQGPRRQSKAQTHNVLDPPTGKGRADRA